MKYITYGTFIGCAFFCLAAITVHAATWEEAPNSPPSNNADAPLHSGNADQRKTGGIRIGNMAFGFCPWAGCDYEYESVNLPSSNNLRVFFGATERFIFTNAGTLVANNNIRALGALSSVGKAIFEAGIDVTGLAKFNGIPGLLGNIRFP